MIKRVFLKKFAFALVPGSHWSDGILRRLSAPADVVYWGRAAASAGGELQPPLLSATADLAAIQGCAIALLQSYP